MTAIQIIELIASFIVGAALGAGGGYWYGVTHAAQTVVNASNADIEQAKSIEAKQVQDLRDGLQKDLATIQTADPNDIAKDLEDMK